uniref:Uncharacterized protein n=2 Tax=Brassica oleracea TaxID=3712 RepID=A0A0D3A443_BRAOL|nr:unnamed protein product [Brassica oleracea]
MAAFDQKPQNDNKESVSPSMMIKPLDSCTSLDKDITQTRMRRKRSRRQPLKDITNLFVSSSPVSSSFMVWSGGAGLVIPQAEESTLRALQAVPFSSWRGSGVWRSFVKLDLYHMIQLQEDFYLILEGATDKGFESLCLSAGPPLYSVVGSVVAAYPSAVGIVVFMVKPSLVSRSVGSAIYKFVQRVWSNFHRVWPLNPSFICVSLSVKVMSSKEITGSLLLRRRFGSSRHPRQRGKPHGLRIIVYGREHQTAPKKLKAGYRNMPDLVGRRK